MARVPAFLVNNQQEHQVQTMGAILSATVVSILPAHSVLAARALRKPSGSESLNVSRWRHPGRDPGCRGRADTRLRS